MMTTKGVEDGMGDEQAVRQVYPSASTEEITPFLHIMWDKSPATPAMQDEVGSATTADALTTLFRFVPDQPCEHVWSDCAPVGNQGVTKEYCNKCAITRPPVKQETAYSPTLKDEVDAMLAELNMPGQLCGETVRILMPYLEDAVKWRKR